MPKYVKVVSFSCVHVPHDDKAARKWLVQTIRDERPDYVVHHGDALEADAASRWPSEQDHHLIDEYSAADDYFAEIDDAKGDATGVFCEGNHDDNILARHRISPKLRDLCDYRKHIPRLAAWKRGADYEYNRDRGVFRLGQVSFMHGYETSESGMAAQAITMGNPFGLCVWGHTHRPQPVTQVFRGQAPLPYWWMDVGCMCNMDNDYMKRKRQWRWGQACAIINLNPSAGTAKSPRMSPHWDADLRIFRMYEPDLYQRKASA